MKYTMLITSYYAILIGIIIFVFLVIMTAIVNLFSRVPFVPTKKKIIKYVAKIARIKKNEKVYDLGCGDGRFLSESQKYTNIQAQGYENAPVPYLMAKVREWMSNGKIQVSMNNFFRQNLSDADVIYCYLGPEVMVDLGKKISQECKKGTRIYSNTFSIQNMKPKKKWPKDHMKRLPTIYMYEI